MVEELLIVDPKRGVIGEFVWLNNNFFQVGKDFPPSRRRKQIQLNKFGLPLANNFPPSRSRY